MRRAVVLALVILVSGCAESVRQQQMEIAITPAGGIKYDRDIPACVTLSPEEQLAWRALQGAAMGVAIGAGIGALAGGANAIPAMWQGAAAGAGAGGLAGAALGYRDLNNPSAGCDKEPPAPTANKPQ